MFRKPVFRKAIRYTSYIFFLSLAGLASAFLGILGSKKDHDHNDHEHIGLIPTVYADVPSDGGAGSAGGGGSAGSDCDSGSDSGDCCE